jgi:type II secretory pathway component PulJ
MRTRFSNRRGLTLVEMLVVVGLLVLMMTMLVAIFREATGSVSAQQAFANIDSSLRRIDTTLRSDLKGVTARMTPPLNPRENLGYFTYEEHQHADAQGEDSDDILAFTAQAPTGRPFTGRIWVPFQNANTATQTLMPITVSSPFAEIIYFLRNGNLYRRVLLVMPERADSLGKVQKPEAPGVKFKPSNLGSDWQDDALATNGFATLLSGVPANVSWLGLNDISCRPAPSFSLSGSRVPVPNTLGDLTNRHNRFCSPRFNNDFNGDGYPDDTNADGLPDYVPTLYPGNLPLRNYPGGSPPPGLLATPDAQAFPYVFPGAYSAPDPNGSFHGMPFPINHNPLEVGDSLPPPAIRQTWWGRPTWRETLSPNWLDPLKRLTDPPIGEQFPGLSRLSNFVPLPPQSGFPNDPTVGNNTFAGMANFGFWEDDLLATGVRSFDVKALDPNATLYPGVAAGYYDLGYAAPPGTVPANTLPLQLFTFGHEGRIPPLPGDLRTNPKWPVYNLGDGSAATVRLQRVFDTWSTDYSSVPDVPADPRFGPPFAAPVYPSYPAPYPIPLRGIQIQIRVVDPKNERVKSLTINQDFTPRL